MRREPALLPGEVSLAHHSMLFVNELPEFSAKGKGVVSSFEAILTTLVPPRLMSCHGLRGVRPLALQHV